VTTPTHYRFAQYAALGAALIVLLALLVASSGLRSFDLRAQQTMHPMPSRPKFNSSKPPADPLMPFRVGETLNYQVSWAAFSNAANAQFNVVERRDLFGRTTWHLRAAAHTAGSVRTLFTVDDQFDSYTDAANLESRQYEMYLNELGKKESKVVHMLPVGEASRAPGPSVVVPPGTRDPLGAFYMLRSVDWKATPQVRAPVYDGHDMYEVRASLEAPDETVTVAAGKFACSRVAIHVFEYQKEVSSIGFVVWFANSADRTPVQIEGNFPFGSVHAELTHSAP
jgi:Protein of unknown function (DUF3108)